jgi:hypothetical protein
MESQLAELERGLRAEAAEGERKLRAELAVLKIFRQEEKEEDEDEDEDEGQPSTNRHGCQPRRAMS